MTVTYMKIWNPARREVISEVPVAGPDDINNALNVAIEAKKVWGSMPVHQRYELLMKYAAILEQNRGRLAELLAMESGKPIVQTGWEIDTAVRLFRGYAERSKALHGEAFTLDSQAGLEHDVLITRREPLGVMLAIIPFNFPIDVFGHKVAPGLAAGNVVIVCPPPDDPLAVNEAVKLFEAAGFPHNVVQVLNGPGPQVAGLMTADHRVDVISLTGSTQTGITVAQNAAKHLGRTILELGGNDPMIIFDDADIVLAVEEAIFGRLLANGQCCCANKRLLVHKHVLSDFTEMLVERLRNVTIGDPLVPSTELGPLIKTEAKQKALQQVAANTSMGAKSIVVADVEADSNYFSPVVLYDVTVDMPVAREMEIFAPVFPIIGFDSDDEAIEISNASPFGLNASVFTKSIERAFRISYALECGIVSINRTGLYRPDLAAFGGYKMSGLGREGLNYSLEELTQIKSIAFRGVL